MVDVVQCYTGLDFAQSVEPVFVKTPTVILYYGILKGNGSTIPDLVLHISSISLSKRGAYTTTPDSLQMVVPNEPLTAQQITDRLDYDLELWRATTFTDGTTLDIKVTDVNFESATLDIGGRKLSQTFSGTRTRTYNGATPYLITGVMELTGDYLDADARKTMKLGALEGISMEPSDTVVFGSYELTIDLFALSVSTNGESITITEVAAP